MKRIEFTGDKHHICLQCNLTDNNNQSMNFPSRKKEKDDVPDNNAKK